MKLWYYPRMFRQLPENEMKAAFQPVEIPDDEGKRRLCEHNQLISYEYAMHLQTILGGSKPEEPKTWVSSWTGENVESGSPDGTQGGGTGKSKVEDATGNNPKI